MAQMLMYFMRFQEVPIQKKFVKKGEKNQSERMEGLVN